MGGNSTKATSGINGSGTQTQQELGIPDNSKLFFEDTKRSVSLSSIPAPAESGSFGHPGGCVRVARECLKYDRVTGSGFWFRCSFCHNAVIPSHVLHLGCLSVQATVPQSVCSLVHACVLHIKLVSRRRRIGCAGPAPRVLRRNTETPFSPYVTRLSLFCLACAETYF